MLIQRKLVAGSFYKTKMIRSEGIAKRINEYIKVWRKDHTKLVVAIDGYAGSGKTTVADFIAKQNIDVLVIHLDDFIKHWKERKQMIDRAKDKSKVFEYGWYRYDDLQKLVDQFKNRQSGSVKYKTYDFDRNDFGMKRSFDLSKKILVLDGVFLLHPKHSINRLWDKRIYIDVDFDKADKKRIAREKKKWGKGYLPENHPNNWVQYFKVAYRRYLGTYKPYGVADVVFKRPKTTRVKPKV